VGRSRADADLALGALRHTQGGGCVAGVADVLADVLALHSADVLEAVDRYSPLSALTAFDRAHNAELVASARAYLAHGGDVADAAASLHVHSNTLRNRLRRASRSCGVDLDDVDTRLVLMLHLKVDALRPVSRMT
ncbi:MAG: PucR family transcriptional regulator, partial [Nocardioidaceae bacterium]